MRDEIYNDLMRDSTEYCCYCGVEKSRISCCGENHFEKYRDMTEDQQEEILDYVMNKE